MRCSTVVVLNEANDLPRGNGLLSGSTCGCEMMANRPAKQRIYCGYIIKQQIEPAIVTDNIRDVCVGCQKNATKGDYQTLIAISNKLKMYLFYNNIPLREER